MIPPTILYKEKIMSGIMLHDARWVRQSFLVESDKLLALDNKNRTRTTASDKFTDTTPGGNICINPPPQFTSNCDIKVKGKFSPSQGMGRYYSEAIDDNSQIIHMRFGVPQYNSLTTFFTGFYNSVAGNLARTGRGMGLFYYLGKAAGFIIQLAFWQVTALIALGTVMRFALQMPSSKFYYLKPTMPVYWSTVQTIVNKIATNAGILPRSLGNSNVSNGYMFDEDALRSLSEAAGDKIIFDPTGGINVYAMANKAQRLARAKRNKMKQALDNQNKNASIADLILGIEKENVTDNYTADSFTTYTDKWSALNVGKMKDNTNSAAENFNPEEAKSNTLLDFFNAEMDDGSAFASFRVNYTGASSESFSNSVTESEIQQKMNSMSSSARSTNFSFAGGNISDGVVGKLVGGALSAAKDFVAGAADSLGVSGLAMLAGGAFVDIPKHWQSSSASLPRANYTINLVSPYGNPISQLLNIHIPLAMLLAGALPLATGRQSYTSPFILELYDQGRCQIRLGMIDSLSITRGSGNLGYNNDSKAMRIDVNFSIVDLSSVISVPVTKGFSMGASQAILDAGTGVGAAIGTLTGATGGGIAGGVTGGTIGAVLGTGVGVAGAATIGQGIDLIGNISTAISGLFEDDNAFNDYMAVLAAMSLPDQIYSFRKFKVNLTNQIENFDKFYSKANYAALMGDSLAGRTISAVYKGTDR